MSTETYITIHDSLLIEKCEEEGHFKHLSHTYLFVGPREVNVSDNVKVIVCRDYSPNYEQYPHFYDFTGWFVLANNSIVKTDNVIFLQYDHINVQTNIEDVVNDALKEVNMVTFYGAPRNMFTLDVPNFYQNQVKALRSCGVVLGELMSATPFDVWPSTQGTAWRTEDFNDFMLWFEPAFEELKDELYAGHLAERMIQPYLMAHMKTFAPIHGMATHQALDCHGTSAYARNDLDSFNNKSLRFGT